MRSMLLLLATLWSLQGLLLVAWWVENRRYLRRLRRMKRAADRHIPKPELGYCSLPSENPYDFTFCGVAADRCNWIPDPDWYSPARRSR